MDTKDQPDGSRPNGAGPRRRSHAVWKAGLLDGAAGLGGEARSPRCSCNGGRTVILAAAQAYLDGDTPLSVRDCGECIARTRKARVSIPERTETNTITYRYEERDVEAKDIVSGFIHPKNEFGLDFNPDTLEPYFPVVKLSFADGSSAVMAITKKADKAEGGRGEGNQEKVDGRTDVQRRQRRQRQ